MSPMCFTAVQHYSLLLNRPTMPLWMSDCSLTQCIFKYPSKWWCTYSTVWMVHSYVHAMWNCCVSAHVPVYVTLFKATYVGCKCLAVTCHLHFWQNDWDLLHATAATLVTGVEQIQKRVRTESWPWRRKFSCCCCLDLNLLPFNELSPSQLASLSSKVVLLMDHFCLHYDCRTNKNVLILNCNVIYINFYKVHYLFISGIPALILNCNII